MRNFLLIFLMTNRIYVSYSVPNKGQARVSSKGISANPHPEFAFTYLSPIFHHERVKVR